MKKINRIIYNFLLLFLIVGTFAFADNTNMNTGMQLFYSKKLADAIPYFEKTLSEDAKNTLAVTYLLDCYEKTGKLNEITKVFEKTASEKPQDALAQAYYGLSMFTKSLIDPSLDNETAEIFKNAIKLDPNLSMAYTGLGMTYFQRRMIPRARALFINAIQLNPNDIVATELYSNILLVDDKKPESALDYLNKNAELLPEYPDTYYYIGSCNYDLDKGDETIAGLNKAMALDPLGLTSGFNAAVLLGDYYFKTKNYPMAIKAFEQALKINPESMYAKFRLERSKNPNAPIKSIQKDKE